MAHSDLDQLLNALMPFAQQMLSKHGEFFPFGAAMSADGEIGLHAGDTGEEQPEAQEVIGLLTAGFRQQAAEGSIRAAGVCVDIRTIPPGQQEKTDAISVPLEHQSGEAATVILPYKKGFLGRIKYGEMFAVKRDPEFFVAGNKS